MVGKKCKEKQSSDCGTCIPCAHAFTVSQLTFGLCLNTLCSAFHPTQTDFLATFGNSFLDKYFESCAVEGFFGTLLCVMTVMFM